MGPQVAFASKELAAAIFEVGDHVTALWPGNEDTLADFYPATTLKLHAPGGSGKRRSATVEFSNMTTLMRCDAMRCD